MTDDAANNNSHEPFNLTFVDNNMNVGPAYKFLQGNKFKQRLIEIMMMKDIPQQSALRQVQYSLAGGGQRCIKCWKYGLPGKSADKHLRLCRRIGFNYRVGFATIDEGYYFCYFGCRRFLHKRTLVKHLIRNHEEDSKAWGLKTNKLRKLVDDRPDWERRKLIPKLSDSNVVVKSEQVSRGKAFKHVHRASDYY